MEPQEKLEGVKMDVALGGQAEAHYLGRGTAVLHSPDFPRQSEMAAYVLDHLGWDGNEFDVYQMRLEYPITPSTTFLSWDLPEAP